MSPSDSPFADLIARLDSQTKDLERLREVALFRYGELLSREAIHDRLLGTADQAAAELAAGATVH